MKALLESSISWKNIEKMPEGNYMYYIRRASMKEVTNDFYLEICLNFIPHKDDKGRLESMLCHEFPKVSKVEVKLCYEGTLPEGAEVLRSKSANSTCGSPKEGLAASNIILGKKISDEPIAISEIRSDLGFVVLKGYIFDIKSKSIRNNKQVISCLVSDFTESICVKMIVSNSKGLEINSRLEKDDWIKVRGKVSFDSFEGADVLMARDIEKVSKDAKIDHAADKRVELHAHTKMSAMDGLAEVDDLISMAASFGHKAVAITDHGVVQSFPDAAKCIESNKLDIKIIYGLEGYLIDDENNDVKHSKDYKNLKSYHIIMLAKTQKGLENLYRLVSISHMEFFYRRPRIPKSILREHKEGLIIGSACEAGEIYQMLLKDEDEAKLEKTLSLYDYLEIQPLINNRFLIDDNRVQDEDALKDLNRKIVKIGKKYGKPIVATCDVHYVREEEALNRRIIMSGMGYKDAEMGEGLFFRTTDEMLKEFEYLGEETAKEVVVVNPNKIADTIEKIAPVPEESYRPEIPNADAMLREGCISQAEKLYGKPLPQQVAERLDKELNSIIGNGYAVLYISAQILVEKSLLSGYTVGSRGSVGSSLAATMAGITEVNPLPPHYICMNEKCKNTEFVVDEEYDCGVDLPDEYCPKCGGPYKKEGFNIPFETFMGFEGNKEPDIDLNFAGEYQSIAHEHVEEIFGKENVFRAGTISKIADKTAYGFVGKYFEGKESKVSKWETERLTKQCTGVRRTTGQHPGGIVILPKGHEIYEFCPVQRPANDVNSKVITTHYDYHSIDKNLLKLDILGHDVPSMLRMLKDLTGVDPLAIPLKDKRVDAIFNGTKELDVRLKDYGQTHGTYGIPEFGTTFVRQMLDDIKPGTFSDLIRISGLSHGTDVWINNAKDIIKDGHAKFSEVICTRDDIMNGLIQKGVPAKTAFNIMERVRKGNGVTEDEAKVMHDKGVPSWYIESCKKIGYMFPKAHAVAYVIMSYRIAYYKVYHPLAFYAVFFTMKVAGFNAKVILEGDDSIKRKIKEISQKGKGLSQKESDEVTVLEVALEMIARGYEFGGIDLVRSQSLKFSIHEGKLLLPFRAIAGIGDKAALNIEESVIEGPFISVDDLRERARLNKTAVEALESMGVLEDLPKTNQITFQMEGL